MMKMTAYAAATLTLLGATLTYDNTAFAKGPLEIDATQSPLILAKETKYTDIDLSDLPFGLEEGRIENLRMTFLQETKIPDTEDELISKYTMTMPWLDVSKDGKDKVTLTYPPTMKLEVSISESDEEITFAIDMIQEGTEMELIRDGDRMTYSGTSKSLGFSMAFPEEITEEGELDFTFMGKNLTMKGNGAAEQDYGDLTKLDYEADYTIEATTFELIAAPDGEATQLELTGELGEYAFNGKIRDGTLDYGSSVKDMALNVQKPMPIEISVGSMTSGVVLPTEASPDPQDIIYKFEFSDIGIDETLWAMFDPEELFPRELNKLTVDIGMTALMFVSLLDMESVMSAEESGLPPLMPTNASINSIAFDGLGLVVDMTGEGEMKGTQPNFTGKLLIKGLTDFVQNAQKVGMFGPQEGMMVQGMAQQFGKEDDDGALIFDIETEDGMILVNDTPVAPLPN